MLHTILQRSTRIDTQTHQRGGDSMGAAGAFASVNLEQRVYYTRPNEELF